MHKSAQATIASLLQLSHVHTNVETSQINEVTATYNALQLSHVHTNVETHGQPSILKFNLLASIEPRSYERGNKTCGGLLAKALSLLQLSHVHTNVETPERARKLLKLNTLQLSHVHTNVETFCAATHLIVAIQTLQLSHVHTNVETISDAAVCQDGQSASIEPRSYERGNPITFGETLSRSICFN